MAATKSGSCKPNDPYVQALARWENEGGALASGAGPGLSSGLAEEEMRILQCLGAAVLQQWNDLPTHIQRRLFESSTAEVETERFDQLREQIARFLHNHKDDAAPAADRARETRRLAHDAGTRPSGGAAGSSQRSRR